MNKDPNWMLEMLCEQKLTRMCEDGTLQRYAEERGVGLSEAFGLCAEEAYQPLENVRRAEREAEERTAWARLARELGEEDMPPRPRSAEQVLLEADEQERKDYGFGDRDIQKRARRRGVSYVEAMEELAEEHDARGQTRRAREAEAARVELDELLRGEEF